MANKEEIIERINVALNHIRPYLNADGGDVLLCDVTDDLIVKVKLTGACGGCPFSLYTLKAGVEEALRKEIPEIREVIAEA